MKTTSSGESTEYLLIDKIFGHNLENNVLQKVVLLKTN